MEPGGFQTPLSDRSTIERQMMQGWDRLNEELKKEYSEKGNTINSLLTDTSIRRTPGVGPCAPFFSHFTASKLSISRTPL